MKNKNNGCTQNGKPCRYLDAEGFCSYGAVAGHSKLWVRKNAGIQRINPPDCQLYATAGEQGAASPERSDEANERKAKNRKGVRGHGVSSPQGRPAECDPGNDAPKRTGAPQAGKSAGAGDRQVPPPSDGRVSRRGRYSPEYYQKNKDKYYTKCRSYMWRMQSDTENQKRGLLILAHRTYHGMTQVQLGKRLGLSSETIYRYEHSKTRVPDTVLQKLGIQP